ncbi:hypothetical protein ACS0TY_012664 [Phlomoides rotata]
MDRQTLASSSSSTSGNSSDPPPEDAWFTTYLKLLPQWQSLHSISTEMIPIEISRVNQVDAGRLDIEMSAMLKEQLVKVFSLMKPGMLFQYEPELDAFLEFLIWRFSIWVDKPTPGNALMNLRYRDERAIEPRGKVRTGLEGPGLTVSQKIWYCVATVGGQYIWARLQSFSAFRRWGDTENRSLARRSWFLLQRIEGFYKAASFGNLLIFLLTGRYRSLIERVLKARLVYESPNMNRAVSFEYMNRQLVWNEFSWCCSVDYRLKPEVRTCRKCCCCFFLFSIHHLLGKSSVHSRMTNLQTPRETMLYAPSAKQLQPLHF